MEKGWDGNEGERLRDGENWLGEVVENPCAMPSRLMFEKL